MTSEERRDARLTWRSSTPATRIAPAGRVGQADEQLGQGGLARPGGPDQGHPGAGGDGGRHLGQHRRAAVIGERHPVQLDVQSTGGQRAPRDRVHDLHRGVEHVQDLLPAGHRLLSHVQYLGELGHRLQEDGDQEGEGDQGADGQAALGADGHPDKQHGRGGQDPEQLPGGEEERPDDAGPDLGPAAGLDRAHHPRWAWAWTP
jgi:hypothetical protein